MEQELKLLRCRSKQTFLSVATLDLQEFQSKLKTLDLPPKPWLDVVEPEILAHCLLECNDMYMQRFLIRKGLKIEERTHIKAAKPQQPETRKEKEREPTVNLASFESFREKLKAKKAVLLSRQSQMSELMA